MSLAIFAAKWFARLSALIHREFQPTLDDTYGISYCKEAFHNLGHFILQLCDHLFQPRDFTSPNNLMVAAVILMSAVKRFVQDFKAMKIHGRRVRGSRWGNSPMEYRRRINEFLVIVDRARDRGWWKPELVREIEKAVEKRRSQRQ